MRSSKLAMALHMTGIDSDNMVCRTTCAAYDCNHNRVSVMSERVFKRDTSRTPSMLSRSSQSVVVNVMDLMDNSVAKYMSMALISRISTISSRDIKAHLSKDTETLEHEIN
jgi:hypothetical protein